MARNMPLKLVDNTDLFFAWIYSPEASNTCTGQQVPGLQLYFCFFKEKPKNPKP
jgi:hypothetical protein